MENRSKWLSFQYMQKEQSETSTRTYCTAPRAEVVSVKTLRERLRHQHLFARSMPVTIGLDAIVGGLAGGCIVSSRGCGVERDRARFLLSPPLCVALQATGCLHCDCNYKSRFGQYVTSFFSYHNSGWRVEGVKFVGRLSWTRARGDHPISVFFLIVKTY